MSDDKTFILLDDRGVLRLSGPDVAAFLQGLVSNDLHKLSGERALWSAFLTPQGKYLHDFFLAAAAGAVLLDGEAARRADLLKRLKLYKLRSQVELSDASEDWAVYALFGAGALAALDLPAQAGAARAWGGGVVFVDPRHAGVGLRALLPRAEAEGLLAEAGFAAGARAAWERRRIELGLPDGSRDMQVEKAILLENGFDELGGVDWQKGCYMGQELTARTKYRGLVKKRLLPVEIAGPLPEAGTPVTRDGKEVGEIRSGAEGLALALIRLEALADAPEGALRAGEARLTPRKPDWAVF